MGHPEDDGGAGGGNLKYKCHLSMAVSVCETIEDNLPTQLDQFAKYLHHQEQVWFTIILICFKAR